MVTPFLSQSIASPICAAISQSSSLHINLFLNQASNQSTSPSIAPSIHSFLHPSLHRCQHPLLRPSLHISTHHRSLHLSINQYINHPAYTHSAAVQRRIGWTQRPQRCPTREKGATLVGKLILQVTRPSCPYMGRTCGLIPQYYPTTDVSCNSTMLQ